MDVKEVIVDEYSGKDLDSDFFYVLVAVLVVETKQISKVLQVLSEKFPLESYALQHIKRVRKCADDSKAVEIAFLPADQLASVDREFWSQCGLDESIMDSIDRFKTLPVAKFLPKNRREFSIWGPKWPISFHPDELERQREKGLTEKESNYIISTMRTLLDLCQTHTQRYSADAEDIQFALIVNPNTCNVVCTSLQGLNRLQGQWGDRMDVSAHPLYPPALLCIDQVAAMCRGDVEGKELLLPGQYLCTGLDLFTFTEPDVFAAMALVHSRIRRVFYVQADELRGALGSGLHIHDLQGLNHHYRVFTVTLKDP